MARKEAPPVFAIGHSNQPFESFLDALLAHGVRFVADIRTVPRSRTVPWTWSETLSGLLADHGLGYAHLPRLGGLRKPRPDSPNDAWRNKSFQGYADYMQTPEFEEGLEDLLTIARQAPVAMMCAEAVPWRCHRSLVADALLARGIPVTQIFSATNAKPHKMTPFARVEGDRVTYPASG